MFHAPIPKDESRRLRALRDLGLLDSEPEERFDRVTRVAADHFSVPIATISLIDTHRQWFKSRVGLDVRETSRDVSFCAHAILEDRTLVVPDAVADERFAGNPLVTGPPHIRFYAGHPIKAPTGELLGTLGIVDTVPRVLDERQLDRLRDLAGWVEQEIGRTDDRVAIEKVRESEARLWTLMGTVAEGIVTFAGDGSIRLANQAAEEGFGYAPGSMLDLSIGDLLDIPSTAILTALAAGGGESGILGVRHLTRGRRQDGGTFPMELVITDASIADERVFVAVGQDVTERVKAEEALRKSERRFRAVFDSAAIGIVLADAQDLTFVEVNAAFASMVGFTPEELRGMPFDGFAPDDRIADIDAEVQRWLAAGGAGSLRRTAVITRRDGTTFWAELTVSTVDDAPGQTTHVLGIFEDVTERLAADSVKDEFVSVVGHELRTPLTSIRGSLGLVAGGVTGGLPAEAAEMVDMAISNTDRLVRLVNDILDIERMDAGHLELERAPVAADGLIETSVDAISALADGAHVTVETACRPLIVTADADRVVQTLVNLLGNAVKFSPDDGLVKVEVTRSGDDALFSVSDEGRGIPPDQLDRIFERFRQVDATDAREKGGTGLGLAIAQRIVDLHGGRIWAESPGEAGCTMRFTLPLAAATATVLICGPRDVGKVAAMVSSLGATPRRAETVEEALQAIAEHRPTAIIVPLTDDTAEWAAGLADASAEVGVPVMAMKSYSEGSSPEPAELAEALGTPIPPLTPDTVLIVEDDPDLASLLATTLSRGGATPRVAGTAEEAVAAIRHARPGAIVLDLVLPGDDGFSVVERLRGDGLLTGIPVLVYTALDLRADDRERLQLGNTEFLSKGNATPQDVERRVAQLLGRLHKGHE